MMQQSTLFESSQCKLSNENDAYNKVKVLGQGSMGKAYLVQSSKDSQLYVMKRINIGHLQPKQKDNAMRESQLHSIVQHPNIIGFKEIYHTDKDKLCIIMEYAENGDLDQLIRQRNGVPMSEEMVLSYFVQICLGLREIHAKKIIHRDIKGANIFLTKDGYVKIGDFGISKIIDTTVQASKSFVGTPHYLSPEMVEGKPYSTKADIWSLGVLLYQLCAQKLPFQANSLPLLALRILKGSFPPLTGPYTRQLKALILLMLQVDPKKRPSINDILKKPLLYKHLPKPEQQALPSKTAKTHENPVKPRQQVIKSKDPPLKADEKTRRQQAKDKRNQLRNLMKEDLKQKVTNHIMKRKQQGKEKPGSNINSQAHSKTVTVNDKVKSKKVSEQPAEEKVKAQKSTEKPWKKIKKSSSRKQISVEVFVPEDRPKPPRKSEQIVIPMQRDFKVQIFEGPKLASTSPLTSNQLKQNNRHSSSNDESEHSESEIEQNEDNNANLAEMLDRVNSAQQAVEGLKIPVGLNIGLYEQSENFQIVSQSVQGQPMGHTAQHLQSSTVLQPPNCVNNFSQNLEQCREVLEQGLGEENFIRAYGILRDHMDQSFEQKYQAEQLDAYTFNRQIIQKKLDFLPTKKFTEYIALMYTLLLLEYEQMRKNFDMEK